jgi:uncharacterized protein YabE (DUF348 family)
MIEKFNNCLKKFFSNSPKAKLIIGLVISTGLMLIIYNMKKTLIVSIDGKEQKIVTFKWTVKGALHDNGIVLGTKDKVQPSLEAKIDKDSKIEIKKAVEVEVTVDGKDLKIETAESSISEMLKAEGIVLGEEDEVQPENSTPITEGLKVLITRIESKVVKENQDISYDIVVNSDDNLDKSVTKLIQEGESGKKEVTYKVVYKNGQEVSKKVVGEKVLKEPKDKIMVKGTANTLVLSRGGEVLQYRKNLSMIATAYAGDGITATGVVPKRDSNGLSTIAADPSIIPLGSKVYVQGYGYAVAQDTGGAIKNNKIDLYMNSESEAKKWGVKSVNVYIIAYPGQW